jgi:peptidylprolyl isomerase
MGDSVDLSGDGGVIKTIVRKSKSDAVAPTEDFPVVDGMLSRNANTSSELV